MRVAHHSGSRFVARILGLDAHLDEFEFVEDPLSDVLTVADNTAGPDGSMVGLTERLQEKSLRHGADSPAARANPERDDYIRAAAARVTQRLADLERTDPLPDLRAHLPNWTTPPSIVTGARCSISSALKHAGGGPALVRRVRGHDIRSYTTTTFPGQAVDVAVAVFRQEQAIAAAQREPAIAATRQEQDLPRGDPR